MGKLTALKPTLGTIAPVLGYAQGDEKAQDKSRNRLAPWRAWYKTTRWIKLRQVILRRDLYTCQMCGRLSAAGMVVDHIKPHRGSEALFWDERNLQVLCGSPCHSKHKQAAEHSYASCRVSSNRHERVAPALPARDVGRNRQSPA